MTIVRACAVIVGVLWLGVATSRAQNARPITGDTAAAIQAWVQAVRSHAPGRVDTPVPAIASLSYEAREELNAGMSLFVAALLGERYDTQRNPAAKLIVDIAHGAGNPTAAAFLKQAAMLHTDVASYGYRNLAVVTGPDVHRRTEGEEFRSGMGHITIARQAVPPLLTRSGLVLTRDGEVLGEVAASWNWPFARFLLDLVAAGRAEEPAPGTEHRRRAADPFVSDWYHATTAYMLAAGAYGDLTPHLAHAADLLPGDPRVLFDGGCYAELLGLPLIQALLSDREIAAARSRENAPAWARRVPGPELRVPSVDRTNAEAERLFRRAVQADPALLEARVRLARLLQARGRHEEAAAELTLALAGDPGGVAGFFARLFAGRAAQALGHQDEASTHYQEALRLFPDAQSALLASSQLALLGADVRATLTPVERLGVRSGEFTADPWWQYHLGPGRDADELLQALWATVPR